MNKVFFLQNYVFRFSSSFFFLGARKKEKMALEIPRIFSPSTCVKYEHGVLNFAVCIVDCVMLQKSQWIDCYVTEKPVDRLCYVTEKPVDRLCYVTEKPVDRLCYVTEKPVDRLCYVTEKPVDDPFHLYAEVHDMLHDLTVFGKITNLMKTLRRTYQGYVSSPHSLFMASWPLPILPSPMSHTPTQNSGLCYATKTKHPIMAFVIENNDNCGILDRPVLSEPSVPTFHILS